MTNGDFVRCVCGQDLNEEFGLPIERRTPCPTCGSTGRMFGKALEPASLSMKASLGGRGKRPGFRSGGRKRPFAEFIEGWVPSFAHGWVKKSWLVDRSTNRYKERIELEDGTVTKDVESTLDEHTGHGSDRPLN